jgi:nitrile hydratase accessory protein
MGMSEQQRRPALELEGPSAPPRKNGELVFDSQWEARLFGLTMALHEAGLFEWEEFRQRLIAEIADWERHHPGSDASWSYYERWLTAFETLLGERGLCSLSEIDARADEFAARPHGHDH